MTLRSLTWLNPDKDIYLIVLYPWNICVLNNDVLSLTLFNPWQGFILGMAFSCQMCIIDIVLSLIFLCPLSMLCLLTMLCPRCSIPGLTYKRYTQISMLDIVLSLIFLCSSTMLCPLHCSIPGLTYKRYTQICILDIVLSLIFLCPLTIPVLDIVQFQALSCKTYTSILYWTLLCPWKSSVL